MRLLKKTGGSDADADDDDTERLQIPAISPSGCYLIGFNNINL